MSNTQPHTTKSSTPSREREGKTDATQVRRILRLRRLQGQARDGGPGRLRRARREALPLLERRGADGLRERGAGHRPGGRRQVGGDGERAGPEEGLLQLLLRHPRSTADY